MNSPYRVKEAKGGNQSRNSLTDDDESDRLSTLSETPAPAQAENRIGFYFHLSKTNFQKNCEKKRNLIVLSQY